MRKYKPIYSLILLLFLSLHSSAQDSTALYSKLTNTPVFSLGVESTFDDILHTDADTQPAGYSQFNFGFSYVWKNVYAGFNGGISSLYYKADSGNYRVSQIPLGIHVGLLAEERAVLEFGAGSSLSHDADTSIAVLNGNYFYGKAGLYIGELRNLAVVFGIRSSAIQLENKQYSKRTLFTLGLLFHIY